LRAPQIRALTRAVRKVIPVTVDHAQWPELLGADFAVENGRYRITKIYDDENWNPDLRAPLAAPGVDVRVGDYLMAINGVELKGTDNVYRLLDGTANKQVVLTVNATPTMTGARTWTRQQKFRLVLGPLDRAKFQSLLPGGSALPKLSALVRNYVGDQLHWDLRLILEEKVEQPFRLGQARPSWTSWLGRAAGTRRAALVSDPQADAAQATAA